MPTSPILADAIVEAFAAHGVERLFGVPGGGSSLDIIDAAGRAGLDFVLTRTETAAAIMAAVTGELTGTPGVVLTGIGPGATSAVNGIAYAYLEKSPLVLLTDGPATSPHQALDQNALFRPVTKYQGRLRPDRGRSEIEAAIECALTPPLGPVQLDLTADDAGTVVGDEAPSAPAGPEVEIDAEAVEQAHALLARCRKPVVIVGLEARAPQAAAAVNRLTEALGCPVLSTYKAKGVVADSQTGIVGLFTGAAAEADCIAAADLVILAELDPVEIIPSRWRYPAPVLGLGPVRHEDSVIPPTCSLTGRLDLIVEKLLPVLETSDWRPDEIAGLRQNMRQRLALRGRGNTAQSVIEAAGDVAPPGCRLAVDAGAHMFATMAFWHAEETLGVLKSNGLSSMGYAVPAAIASALQEPERPVLAISGDGGLMMCLSELATAVEQGCRIVVIVLNDASLSLIDIKQQRQQRQTSGVRYPRVDLAGAAEALGCRVWRVGADADPAKALRAAFASDRPSLIDIAVDPDGYGDQLAALRG